MFDFCSFESAPACSLIRSCRRGSRIFLGTVAWLDYPTHPKQSLCSGSNASHFRSLRSKPVFPLDEIARRNQHVISITILSFFQKARTERNTKRHFAFRRKDFCFDWRKNTCCLMNIYPCKEKIDKDLFLWYI